MRRETGAIISKGAATLHRTSRFAWKTRFGECCLKGVRLMSILGVMALLVLPPPGDNKGLTSFSQVALAQSPPFHYGVKVEMVDVYATVHNRAGKLVTRLNENDFVIFDNGIPQAISQFSRDYIPLSVLILLDTSGSMAGKKLENAKRSLIQFLKRLNHGDEAMLMTFRSRPRIVQSFTQDMDKIKQGLRRLEGDGSTALYDAILTGLDQIRQSHNRRRTLLLISDGINTYGRTQLKDTIEVLRARGVELFAIGIEEAFPQDARDRIVTRSVLDQLTGSAGGESFVISDARDLGDICHNISDQMHHQYSLGYYVPKVKETGWHDIRIETKVPGLTVIPSKMGYYPSAPPSR